MRSVQIYVENQLLDLFNDEQIVVNSSVQNISDIGKVFTDFSQTFTIPCSPNNNYIFEHYYNNDVDNQIDHNRRRTARITIDHEPFRTGKIQLEKSTVKNNYGESYTVTFYGDVTTLKDILGEDRLKDLDYTSLDHTYSGAEVQARVETDPASVSYDVYYPLISSTRVWQYGSADTNDISLNTSPIDYTELFPAVRVRSLFDKIESTYNVTFKGSWLDSKHFNNLFLWYKNKESFTFYTKGTQLEFGEAGASTDNLYNNTVQYSYVNPITLLTGIYDVAINVKHHVDIEIFTGSSINYYIDIFDNGNYLLSLSGNGAQLFTNAFQDLNDGGLDRNLTFKLRSTAAMTFSCTVTYRLTYNLIDVGTNANVPTTVTYSDSSDTSLATTAITDLSYLAPDMTINEFMNGIFNVFNLTCTGEDVTTFRIEPLDVFYNNGAEWDITEYTDFESIDVDRPKLFNNISFKWQPSQSFMNREFFDLFRREYSDLSAFFGYDGGDYTIQLPFETPLHTKFTNTNLQVGYCLGTEPEYKNYVPKPTLLYLYDYQNTNVSFYLDNGTTVDEITGYNMFGQDIYYSDDEYTLNFGSEISSFTLEVEQNTLYKTYYQSYLQNLYDLKTRVLNVKCNFPIRQLTRIKLNDSLIIRDKKYLINEMKSNLVTGEVNLVLLSNWRDSQIYGGEYNVSCASQDLLVSFSVPDNVTLTIGTPYETQFATPDNTSPTGEDIVTFSCTSNSTGATRTNTFPLTITVNGTTLPTQYIIIYQARCKNKRIIESVLPQLWRVSENGLYRITE